MKNYWLKIFFVYFIIVIWAVFCSYCDCKISIEYYLHNKGNFSLLSRGIFVVIYMIIIIVINVFYDNKYGEGYEEYMIRNCLSESEQMKLRRNFYIKGVFRTSIFPFILLFAYLKIGNVYMSTIKEEALQNSYYSFGYVYEMHRDIKGMPYSVWTGLEENKTMRNSNVGAKIYNQINPGDTILVQVSLKYPAMHKVIKWILEPSDYELYSKPDNRIIVNDLASLDGDSLCKKFGIYLVYKAVADTFLNNNSEVVLKFENINMEQNRIRYKLPDGVPILDTFLVYQNINKLVDDRLIVCTSKINTQENWSKISDYGYIFHYDIYRKEEIETQCPQIKNYVEKFKERNINK